MQQDTDVERSVPRMLFWSVDCQGFMSSFLLLREKDLNIFMHLNNPLAGCL